MYMPTVTSGYIPVSTCGKLTLNLWWCFVHFLRDFYFEMADTHVFCQWCCESCCPRLVIALIHAWNSSNCAELVAHVSTSLRTVKSRNLETKTNCATLICRRLDSMDANTSTLLCAKCRNPSRKFLAKVKFAPKKKEINNHLLFGLLLVLANIGTVQVAPFALHSLWQEFAQESTTRHICKTVGKQQEQILLRIHLCLFLRNESRQPRTLRTRWRGDAVTGAAHASRWKQHIQQYHMYYLSIRYRHRRRHRCRHVACT